jgi:hypothetical protein
MEIIVTDMKVDRPIVFGFTRPISLPEQSICAMMPAMSQSRNRFWVNGDGGIEIQGGVGIIGN